MSKFSINDPSDVYHIALGLGVCGIAFYLSGNFDEEDSELKKSNNP